MARLVTILAAIAIVALTGCGGGGDSISTSTSTTATSTTTTQTETAAKATPKRKSKSKEKKQAQQKQKEPAPAPRPYSGPAATDPNPLPNQGTKAVAPGVPTSHGGDNSIQRYGTEAGSSERVEATQIVGSYLQAQAEGRWDEACSYLTSKVRSGLEDLARKAKGKAGEGCSGAMAAFLGKTPQGVLQKAAEIQVLSFRVQGDLGFLVYRDGTGKPFNMPLRREGGQWKVGALAGVGLVL